MQQETDPTPPKIRRLASVLRLATVALFLAMFVGTHIPGGMQPEVGYSDKLLHFSAYMVLAILALASWELSTGPLQPKHYLIVWLAGMLYGAFDEITQIPVGRSCDFADWIADTSGVLAGLAIYRILSPLVYRLLFIRPRMVRSP